MLVVAFFYALPLRSDPEADMQSPKIQINGVTPALVKTRDALSFVGLGRTKFYDTARRAGVAPVATGRGSLWTPDDLSKIVAEIVRSARGSAAA